MSRVQTHDFGSCCCLPIVWKSFDTFGFAIFRTGQRPRGSTTYRGSRDSIGNASTVCIKFDDPILPIWQDVRVHMLLRLSYLRMPRRPRSVAYHSDWRLAEQHVNATEHGRTSGYDFYVRALEQYWCCHSAPQEVRDPAHLCRSSCRRARYSSEGH